MARRKLTPGKEASMQYGSKVVVKCCTEYSACALCKLTLLKRIATCEADAQL